MDSFQYFFPTWMNTPIELFYQWKRRYFAKIYRTSGSKSSSINSGT